MINSGLNKKPGSNGFDHGWGLITWLRGRCPWVEVATEPAFKPFFVKPMHNVQKDWIGAVVIAALGAGVITSFAVSQGQNPLVGLAITLFAAVSAVTIDHFL